MSDCNFNNEEGLFPENVNKSTRIFVIVSGIFIGISAIIHGVFEILKGNRPVSGVELLNNIGAFSIIPNYLWTGIASIIVSLFLMIWTIKFIHKKNGPVIFLIFSIILFFVGGGIAQLLLFLMTWGVSSRINKQLTWWRMVLSANIRKRLAKLWPVFFIISYIFLLIGVGIWLLLLPPGSPQFDKITSLHFVDWSFLLTGFIFLIVTIISGFARDTIKRKN